MLVNSLVKSATIISYSNLSNLLLLTQVPSTKHPLMKNFSPWLSLSPFKSEAFTEVMDASQSSNSFKVFRHWEDDGTNNQNNSDHNLHAREIGIFEALLVSTFYFVFLNFLKPLNVGLISLNSVVQSSIKVEAARGSRSNPTLYARSYRNRGRKSNIFHTCSTNFKWP